MFHIMRKINKLYFVARFKQVSMPQAHYKLKHLLLAYEQQHQIDHIYDQVRILRTSSLVDPVSLASFVTEYVPIRCLSLCSAQQRQAFLPVYLASFGMKNMFFPKAFKYVQEFSQYINRMVLSTVSFLGSGQFINIFLECFGNEYVAQNPSSLITIDDYFEACYAVLLMNTDISIARRNEAISNACSGNLDRAWCELVFDYLLQEPLKSNE